MSTVAVVMMIVAIVVVWGGLAASIRFLARHPLDDREELETILEDGPEADTTW